MKRSTWAALAAGAILLSGLGACSEAGSEPGPLPPPVTFDTTSLRLISGGDTVGMTAEIAANEDQRAFGLMERASLPADHGMIFVYPDTRGSTGAFYMFRTLIPLDIAFFDDSGRIVSIMGMQPCPSPNPQLCRRYSPGVPYRGALEANLGFFERHGIEVGDVVEPVPTTLE